MSNAKHLRRQDAPIAQRIRDAVLAERQRCAAVCEQYATDSAACRHADPPADRATYRGRDLEGAGMTGRPLDDEIEELMRQCEGIMFTLNSPQWNALRDRIRATMITPEQAKAYQVGTHGGAAKDCPACSCRRKLADIAELAQ